MEYDYEKIKAWVIENKVLIGVAFVSFVLGAWIF
jgi:hypothetical protein